MQIAEKVKQKKYPEVDEIENEKGFGIEKNWYCELAINTQAGIKKHGICYEYGRLLYAYLSDVKIFETWTAQGFSSLCMTKSLGNNNVNCQIFTFDIFPHNSLIYWNCIDNY